MFNISSVQYFVSVNFVSSLYQTNVLVTSPLVPFNNKYISQVNQFYFLIVINLGKLVGEWGVIGDVGIVTESATGEEVVLLGSSSQRIPSLFGTSDQILDGTAVTQKNVSTVLDLGKAGRQDLIKSICHIMGIKDISSIYGGTSLGSLGVDSLIAIGKNSGKNHRQRFWNVIQPETDSRR